MIKRYAVVLAAASLCIPLAALAQQQEAPVFTYVAEWTVERAHWSDFAAFLDKNAKPVLDRLVADGTIAEWGRTENAVHTEEGFTHAIWWAAPAFSGTQRVQDALVKASGAAGGQPGITKHRDYLFRSLVFRVRHSGDTTGYLMTTYNVVKPGKGREWRELWEKNTRPVLETLLEEKTILGYGIDVEHVHTGTPLARYGWIVAPTAEALDKVNAAMSALQLKRTPEERRAMDAAYQDVSVSEAHRDGLERIVTYVRK